MVCRVSTTQNGHFVFSSLPSGPYTLVPYYHSGSTAFDVQPASLSVLVDSHSLVLTQAFNVAGFAISGRFFFCFFCCWFDRTFEWLCIHLIEIIEHILLTTTFRVLDSLDHGVADAEVFLNGKQLRSTAQDGTFQLDSIKAGELRVRTREINLWMS